MSALNIYILDDDPASLAVIGEMLGVGYPGANLSPFTDHKGLLAAEGLCTGDLFIIDVCLTNQDGRELPAMMPAACRLKPFLFISGFPIEDEDFDALEGLVAFDFIGKPFALRHFLHRVGVLMDAAPAPTAPIDDVFDLMTYAPFVAVVLDEALRVRYCNQQAAVLLEEKSAAQVVGRNWLDFIPKGDVAPLKQIHNTLLEGDLRHFGEYTNPIITAAGNLKTIRWFNTPFEGAEGQTLTLSVGVPSQMEASVIDKIRRLWGERIQRDKAAIRAVKPLVPAKILSCEV